MDNAEFRISRRKERTRKRGNEKKEQCMLGGKRDEEALRSIIQQTMISNFGEMRTIIRGKL